MDFDFFLFSVPELSPGIHNKEILKIYKCQIFLGMHKGEAGRIGIIGGSTEYTGAINYQILQKT